MTSIEEVLSDISKLPRFQVPSVKSNIQQYVSDDALKSRILTVLDSISAPKVNTDDDKGTLSGKAKALAGSGGGCCGCVTIPLTLSNTGPTTISAPGNYVLQNSPSMVITGAGPFNPNICLQIESSDVHVNLCGEVLTGPETRPPL